VQTSYVHVYTGEGKGKTTAALGLALRTIGAGHRAFVGQFVKGMEYSELHAAPLLGDRLRIEQLGRDCFIYREPDEEDRRLAREGLARMATVLRSGEFRLVVLDEANIAVHFGLFTVEELIEALRQRAPEVEAVVTGRRAHPALIEYADLVTEMREIKHYYSQGVVARRGIES
jgi:cob(I)alamin adenosyltransferase